MLEALLRHRAPQSTAAAGAVRDDPPVTETASTPAVAVTTSPAPPPARGSIDVEIDRGVCWHPAHADLDGERYGVTPIGPGLPVQAALTLCRFRNPDGC